MGKKCPDKIRFRDRLGAELALLRQAGKPDAPVRSYRCRICGGWHTTSQPKRT